MKPMSSAMKSPGQQNTYTPSAAVSGARSWLAGATVGCVTAGLSSTSLAASTTPDGAGGVLLRAVVLNMGQDAARITDIDAAANLEAAAPVDLGV